MTQDAMVRLILASRVYDVARTTPLEPARRLSLRTGNQVLLKREDLQPIFTYKLRGAYNRIAHLSDAEKARGVITASAGNHAQGVAYAAQQIGEGAARLERAGVLQQLELERQAIGRKVEFGRIDLDHGR